MDKKDLIEVSVQSIQVETPEIRSFVLVATDGSALPEFEAGAHIDVYPIPDMVRQYSLVNNPSDRQRYVIGVKREVNGRGGSNAMHSSIAEGDTLTISKPKNNFSMRQVKGRSLLFAGGIGITPLLSMTQVLAEQQSDFELHHFTRSNAEMSFNELITNSKWSSNVYHHFNLVPPSLTDLLTEVLRSPNKNDIVYLCGPELFMDAVRDVALSCGWAAQSVMLEHFSAKTSELSPDSNEFVVRLAKRDLEFIVPADKTIIQVLDEAGISIVTSCEQGVCGTCVTTVLEGEADHRDVFLTDEDHAAKRLFTPCISRAFSKTLVLDI